MALFTITLSTSISDCYSNRPLINIQDFRCSMHRPRPVTSNIIVYAHPAPHLAHLYNYDDFYGVHVYLRSIRISLEKTQ